MRQPLPLHPGLTDDSSSSKILSNVKGFAAVFRDGKLVERFRLLPGDVIHLFDCPEKDFLVALEEWERT